MFPPQKRLPQPDSDPTLAPDSYPWSTILLQLLEKPRPNPRKTKNKMNATGKLDHRQGAYSRVEKSGEPGVYKELPRAATDNNSSVRTVGLPPQPPLPQSLLPPSLLPPQPPQPPLPPSLLPPLPSLPPSLLPLLLLPPPPPPPPPPTPVVMTRYAEDPRRPAPFAGWNPNEEVHGNSLIPWRPLVRIDLPNDRTRDKATQTDAPLPPPPRRPPMNTAATRQRPTTSAETPRPQLARKIAKTSTGSPSKGRRKTCIICPLLPMTVRKRTRPRLVTSGAKKNKPAQ
ncbi:PREDICTED: WAS/WASL-interacting protein family member 3-like [Vollenhovia emeryi]|uniref:WAS/WASL-interacting protein family member 3-like n=1 Tax=Vollenhovia emeryi TaxID=411798 RepID=UPI0005F3E3B4|nr:PREDICTED: WAS/WASL-interacting protein family member 3-like [Vollenhovia emeryi]